MFFNNSETKPSQVRDGLSNTVLVAETRYHQMKHERSHLSGIQLHNWLSWDSSLRPYWSGTHAIQFGLVALHEPINTHNKATWCAANNGASSYHPGGCHFAFADGSLHFIAETMDLNVYHSLATRADGLPLEAFR